MTARIWFSPQGRAQAREAAEWWRNNRSKAPQLLARELRHYLKLVAETPSVGRPYQHSAIPDLRRVLLPRTKYHVYYIHHPDDAEIEVVAFWSAVRGRAPV